MKTSAEYIGDAKRALGNPGMSDRELGARLGYTQQAIALSKKKMSDPIALEIGRILQAHGMVEHAGEVLLVAHAERDANPKVRAVLMDYAGKVVRPIADSLPELAGAMGRGLKGAAGVAILATLSALPAQPVEAAPSSAASSLKIMSNRLRRWLGRRAQDLTPPSVRFTAQA